MEKKQKEAILKKLINSATEKQKKVYTLKFDNPVKLVGITDLGIIFSDGTEITHEHKQSCCEDVYADWEALKDQNITSEIFTELAIWGNPNLGIILKCYAVPCYSIQNGYYSSNLHILIKKPNGKTKKVDIYDYIFFDHGD